MTTSHVTTSHVGDDLVWYVAYGSNLCEARFACYLVGGTPAGGRRATPGARDGTPAREWRRVEVPHPLWFGGPSRTWRGGPAFLDVDAVGRSVGRAWLVTREQFADVAAQENGWEPGTVEVDDALLTDGGVLAALHGDRPAPRPVGDAPYARVAVLAPIDGRTSVTVTCPSRPTGRAPDPAYLALVRAGLLECGLAGDEADAALARQPQLGHLAP